MGAFVGEGRLLWVLAVYLTRDHLCACTHVHVCACVSVCMCACVRVCKHMCAGAWVHTRARVCVCGLPW